MVQAQQMMIQNNHKLPKDLERRPSVVLAKPTASPVVPLTSSRSRYSQQTVHEQSSLERLGVYRRKVIRYRYIEPDEMSSNRKSHRKDIIYEADAISLLWKTIGFGLSFTQPYLYGRMFPHLPLILWK
jgi:hypothetical protein